MGALKGDKGVGVRTSVPKRPGRPGRKSEACLGAGQAWPPYKKPTPQKAWRPAGPSRPPTDQPSPASIVEACLGGGQARLHAGRPGRTA